MSEVVSLKKSDNVFQSREIRRERWYVAWPGAMTFRELEERRDAFLDAVKKELERTGAGLRSQAVEIEASGWRLRLSVVVEMKR